MEIGEAHDEICRLQQELKEQAETIAGLRLQVESQFKNIWDMSKEIEFLKKELRKCQRFLGLIRGKGIKISRSFWRSAPEPLGTVGIDPETDCMTVIGVY